MNDRQQLAQRRPLSQAEVLFLEAELRKMLPRLNDPTHRDSVDAAQFRAVVGLPPRDVVH